MTNYLPKYENLSRILLGMFFFIFPFYFLPITYDVIELNKSLFIAVFALVLLVIFTINSIKAKDLKLTIGYLTVPALLFIVAVFLSMVFSISTSYSLWGFYGSLSTSFPILFLSGLLVLLIPSVLKDKFEVRNLLYLFSLGLLLVNFFFVLNYFDAFHLLAGTKLNILSNIAFSPIGPLSSLYFVSFISTILTTFYSVVSVNMYKKSTSILGLALNLVVVCLYTNPLIFVLNAVVSGLILLIFRKYINKKAITTLVSAYLLGFAVFFVTLTPDLRKSFSLDRQIPNLNSISPKVSWQVTNGVLGNRPIFGSGLGTFISVYSSNKPVSVNATNYWDTRFIKPSSFYLLLLVETGLLGFLSFVYILLKLVLNTVNATSIKNLTKGVKGESSDITDSEKPVTKIIPGETELLVAKILAFVLLIIFIFTPANAFLIGTFFAVLGLILAFEKVYNTGKATHRTVGLALGDNDSASSGISSLTLGGYTIFRGYKLLGLVSAFVFVFICYFGYTIFASDFMFRSFFNSPTDLLQLRQNYVNASKISLRNDFYHRSIIEVDKQIVRALVQNEANKDLSDDDKKARLNDIKSLLDEASLRSKYITTDTDLGINPINWESRGLFFQSVLGLVNQADVSSVQAYLVANRIEPNNPRIVATIGTVYFQLKNYQQAATYFEQAVILKPDYAAARYNLAKALEQLERYTDAYLVANTVSGYLSKDSDDYKTAMDYTASLKVKAEEQQKSANEDTGNKIDLQNANTETAQPGLTAPTEPLEKSPENTPVSAEGQNVDNAEVVSPTSVPSTSATPSANPSPSTLPNQEPNTTPGGGFVEQNGQ